MPSLYILSLFQSSDESNIQYWNFEILAFWGDFQFFQFLNPNNQNSKISEEEKNTESTSLALQTEILWDFILDLALSTVGFFGYPQFCFVT